MSSTTLQDILPLVQLPSRYLGNEINRIVKPWNETDLHVALAFPDLYEIATSHFGIQILYGLLNDQDGILAERVYAPAMDMEKQLRARSIPLSSLESRTPLKRFDIVGFSLLYELNYTNMLNMLDLGGIAFKAEDRHPEDPFVIAGGPCTCNPEPVADFFDAMVIGDGEAVIVDMARAWRQWRQSGGSRSDLLDRWRTLNGVYVPAFFKNRVSSAGAVSITPLLSDYRRVERAVVTDLNETYFPASPIVPFGKPIHDRLRMEIARGCTRGCRFCQAGMIYRPVRERRPESILSTISDSLDATGYEDLSLLSLSTGDYACIAPLMTAIMDFGEADRVAVSLPSLRAGSITPELMESIRKVRKTGFTIAPEAGSQRLRNVINKNISESDIMHTVESAFSLGWKVIKLYFMIGLPTETQTDVQAIVDLVGRIKAHIRQISRNGKLNVSIATFVPKPHTPFQWEPQIALDTATEKMNWLKDKMRSPGIQVKWQDPRVSVVEAVWSRGDRRLGEVLIQAWKSGCRFDGWSDHFNYGRWMDVFNRCGIDISDYTAGFEDRHQPLPWDHIHIGVERSYLENERRRAVDEHITADCRTGQCTNCGVCNFKTLKPISYHDHQMAINDEDNRIDVDDTASSHSYELEFNKMGSARFLGHLEMAKLFSRALRRAGIPVKYSLGYHPMPKMAFGDTLPMGMQSESERLYLTLSRRLDPSELASRLQIQLPEGFGVLGCTRRNPSPKAQPEALLIYHVELKDGIFNASDLEWFSDQPVLRIDKTNKKGKHVAVDLKKSVTDIELIDDRHALISLTRYSSQLIRPAQILKTVFKKSEQEITAAIITKCKSNHV